ncbi:hypothetical protein FACS1894166_08000 [Bacilli bacterium]|nr:hypothetical protein FACS1894166_08000 [Bacilli bacterium]
MPNDKDYKLQHCGKPAYKDIDIRFDESNNLEVKSPYMITSFIDSNITNTYFTTDG